MCPRRENLECVSAVEVIMNPQMTKTLSCRDRETSARVTGWNRTWLWAPTLATLLAALSAQAMAEQDHDPARSPSAAGPRWACAQPIITANPVWHGKKVECAFEIRNDGDADLEIGAQAGCDVPFNGPPNRTIKPGHTETLIAYLDTWDLVGPFDRRIKVASNDPYRRVETLRCQGRVLSPFDLESTHITLGPIPQSDVTRYRIVDLKRGDGDPIDPKVGVLDDKEIDVQICEVDPGAHYELVVAIQPQLPVGSFKKSVRLTTGVPQAPYMNVVVTGVVVPRVTLMPKGLALPALRDQPVTRTVRLIWDDGHPAEIVDVTCTIPTATARIVERSGWQLVELTLPAGQRPSGQSHFVTVRTKDPAASSIRIPVQFQ